ncbi:MAG: hypothetical protein ABI689_13460 [Thermoanaerobaculia bacterium]
MKITATLALLAAMAGLAGAGTPTAPATPTADEILERNLAALGGRAKVSAVRSLRLEATQGSAGAGGGSVPLTVYWKHPDRLRIETPEEGLVKVVAFDGTTAWSTYPELPGFEAQVLDGAERDSLREQADLVDGPTFDYAAKGHHVELVGREELGSGKAWKLLLTTAQGEVRALWFDCETYLEVREERTQKAAGQEITTVSLLSDFRPSGGILFAHRTETRPRQPGGPPEGTGEPTVFAIQRLELDVEIPDSLFALPAAPPGPAAAPPGPASAAGPG